MQELLPHCDRILVMYEGRIVDELAGEAMNEQRVMAAAFGQSRVMRSLALQWRASRRRRSGLLHARCGTGAECLAAAAFLRPAVAR